MKRVLKAFAFAAAIVVALVSCKKEDQPKEVALTGIELNATTQTLQVGQEFQLTVTYKPENATSKPAATWASDAPAVATVDGGKVVAVAAGTAKITATVGSFTAECAITVASAEEEILPVEGNSAWSVIGSLLGKSWDTDFVCAEENGAFVLKNVKLAKGNEIKFRKDKAWDVNRGINKENEAAELAAGTPTKAIQGGGNIIIPADGIYDLYYFAEKEAIVYVAKDATLPEIPDFTENTQPEGLVMDGDASDWAELNPDYLVNLELPSDAEKTGIKSAKAYYDDKLYLLVELSDDALADSKARLHVYFDVDNSGLLKQNGWANSTIDYVTEGKVHENGAFVAYGSTLYATLQESWACTDTGFSPAYESAGAGNLYELSMDFEGAPAALPEAFNFGVDVVYSDWSCHGFLPVAEKLARIVKVGATDPGEVVEYVHDYTPSAEYLADSNLWKAVDANHTLDWSYNPNWAGALEAPETTFKESTYEFYLAEECTAGQWTTQMRIVPTEDFLVSSGKKYNFYCNVVSTTGAKIWIKMHKFGENWPIAFETADSDGGASRIVLPAGEIVPIKVEGFEPMYETPTPVCLLFDVTPHAANNTIYIKDIIVEEIVPETGSSVSEIIAAADETAIELKESLVVAKCVRGVVVTDGAKYIYAYGQTPLADVKVGDKVTMKGTKKTYNGVPEIDSPTDVVVKSSGNDVPAIEAKDITATVESYAATEAEYISLTGTLAKSGNYYNLNLEGTTAKVGSISYPLPELNADSFDGKKITVTGFFNGLSGGGKYVNIVTTKIEEVVAFTGITIDGDMSDWAGVEGAVGTGGVNAAFKVSSDETNLYFYVKRTTERMSEVWAGNAYHYYAFDTDGDASNDVDLWGNKADILLVVYPYAGTADAPKIEIAKAGATMPEANSVANAVAKGVVTDSGVETEVSIPRADIVGLPATEFKVSYWSNKGGSEKLTVSLTL